MPLLFPEPYGNTATDAFRAARERGVFLTSMGSAELSELEARILERAVFTARGTNAVYIEGIKSRVQRIIADGYNGDQAQVRLELKQLLAELGYDPVNGFPGDAKLGIPAARPGSLQDLSSDRRINLILDTQIELMGGKGQQQRGLEAAALDLFPAWELVRVRTVETPRDWHTRWGIAGGRKIKDAEGRVRLVAHKLDEIWSVLGDRSLFKDALGVAHPPFAFSSGMAWRAVDADEWADLMKLNGIKPSKAEAGTLPANVLQMPPATISTDGLSKSSVERMMAKLKNVEQRDGKLTLKSIVGSPARVNAWLDQVEIIAQLKAS